MREEVSRSSLFWVKTIRLCHQRVRLVSLALRETACTGFLPSPGYLITKIFHPNVSNAGDICVNTLKRDWKPSNSLSHVLQIVRCLLIVPFPESSLNDDAGKLFMESYEDFSKKAKLMTKIHAMSSTAAAASSAGAAAAPQLEIVDGLHAPAAEMDSSTAAKAPAAAAAASPAAAHGGALAESNAKPARAAAKKPAAAKKSKKKGLKRL